MQKAMPPVQANQTAANFNQSNLMMNHGNFINYRPPMQNNFNMMSQQSMQDELVSMIPGSKVQSSLKSDLKTDLKLGNSSQGMQK